MFNLNAIWVEPDNRDLAESKGYTVVDCPTIIATHLTEIIRRHADEILGREEVKKLIDNIRGDYPAVVKEIEEKMKYGEIQKVLQNLLRERVSIRNMVTILETLATYYDFTTDTGMLTEYVRGALARQIAGTFTNEDNVLSVITVDPEIESVIRGSIHDDPVEGRVLGMDPDTHNAVVNSLLEAYQRSSRMGFTPVFLVSPQIRSVTFALLEREVQAPAVLAYNEISKNIKVNVVVSALMPATA